MVVGPTEPTPVSGELYEADDWIVIHDFFVRLNHDQARRESWR